MKTKRDISYLKMLIKEIAVENEIKRVAQKIAFGADVSDEDPLIVKAAEIYAHDMFEYEMEDEWMNEERRNLSMFNEAEDEEESVEAKFARRAELPEFKPYIDMIKNAADPKELARAKRQIHKDSDAGVTSIPDGLWLHFYELKQKELRFVKDREQVSRDPGKTAERSRQDAILRMRDSSGRAKSRKMT